MQQQTWTRVDEYIERKLLGTDEALEAALATNAEAGLPAFDVAPNQGKFLHLLVRMCGARRILEIGTLGGYSTIWLARAVPADGVVITLESEAKHADAATRNLQRAKLDHLVDVRLGSALESLKLIAEQKLPPFDFIFIDADKPNNPAYLEWALKLSRPGTIIVGDNVVREGAIVDQENRDPRVRGIQQFFDQISSDHRLSATAIQTVGSKGYDGFVLAVVEEATASPH